MSSNIAITLAQMLRASDAIQAAQPINPIRPSRNLASVIEREYEFIPPPGLRIESTPVTEYRPAEVKHLKQTLDQRNQDLHRCEQKLKAIEVVAMIFAAYAIGVTVLMLGGAA